MRLKVFAGLILAFSLLTSAFVTAQSNQYQPFDRKLSRKDEDWVRKTLKSLTLDEKIGQMVIADANVVFWNRESDEYKKLQHHIVDNKVGGVILFARNYAEPGQLRALTGAIRAVVLEVTAAMEERHGNIHRAAQQRSEAARARDE